MPYVIYYLGEDDMANLTTMRAENIASDAEWQTRCELAALYRIMDIYAMTDLSNQAVGAPASKMNPITI